MGERVSIRPEAAEASEGGPVPLDYGKKDTVGDWSRRIDAWLREHFEGLMQSIGALIERCGGRRRFGFAAGLGILGGGLGLCISGEFCLGPTLMTVGAFVLGLYLPLPKKDEK